MATRRFLATMELNDRFSSKLQRIERGLDSFENKVNRQQKVLTGLGTAAEKAGSALLKITGGAIAAGVGYATAKFIALKAAVTSLGIAAYNTNNNFEQMATTLKALYGGNMDLSREAYAWMQEFAARTPFGQADIMGSMVQMIASGMDYQKYLVAAGNLASVRNVPIIEVTRALTRLYAGDFGEAFERLRDFGINYDMLKAEGLKFSNSNQYLGTREEAVEAVYRIIQSRYGQQMEAQSRTVFGILSNIGDSFAMMSQSLWGFDPGTLDYKEGGIGSAVKNVISEVQELTDTISGLWRVMDMRNATAGEKLQVGWKMVTNRLRRWFEDGGREATRAFAEGLGGGLADMIMAVFTGKSDSIWGEIGKTAVEGFIQGFKENFNLSDILESDRGNLLVKALGLGSLMRLAPGAVKLFGGISKVNKELKSAGGLSALFLNGEKGVDTFKALNSAFVTGRGGGLMARLMSPFRMIRQFGPVGNVLGKALPIAGLVSAGLEVAFAKPSQRVQVAAEVGGGLLGGLLGAKAGVAMGAAIGSIFPGVGTAIGGALGGLLGGIIGTGAGRRFVEAFREDGLVGVLSVAVEGAGNIAGTIINGLASGIAKLSGIVVGAFTALWEDIQEWWSKPDKWQRLLDVVGGFFEDFGKKLVNKFREWGSGIASWWDGLKQRTGQSFAEGAAAGYNYGGVYPNAWEGKAIEAPAHHGGVDSAPGGVAILKKGETVLDPNLSAFIRNSAKAYTSAQGGGPTVINIGSLIGTAHIREEADVQKVARALAQELKATFGNRGTVTLAEVAK